MPPVLIVILRAKGSKDLSQVERSFASLKTRFAQDDPDRNF
jgi:hypothetical protein